MAETSTFGILHGRNVRGRNVLAEMSVAETSVAEISYIHRFIYIDLLEKYIPESKPRQNRGKNGPPITQSCITAIKTKHKKWLKYKYCKSHENFNNYKSARNRVTLELCNAKYAYDKNLAARIKTDNKLFWNYVSKK